MKDITATEIEERYKNMKVDISKSDVHLEEILDRMLEKELRNDMEIPL